FRTEMLRNVLIMAASGIVLFSKEYVNTIAQPRLVGSLVTAMLEFSAKTTGNPVSYIELSNVAVTVVSNESHKVFCAMFHDTNDGATFSSFIAKEILDAFIAEYRAELGAVGHNLRDFHRFHYRILAIIRDSVRTVLRKLQQQRGILKAIFVTDSGVTHSTVDVDQIGVLANLQALLNASSDIMALSGDAVNSVTIQSSRTTCTQVNMVENGTLIVMYKKGASAARNIATIKECVQFLRKARVDVVLLLAVCVLRLLRRVAGRTHAWHQHQHMQQRMISTTRSFSSLPESNGVLHDVYRRQVDAGNITYDPVQVRALHHLDALYDQIVSYGGPDACKAASKPKAKAATSWWQRLAGSDTTSTSSSPTHPVPRGIYMHGGVGCGKTFVMDMFFDHVPVEQKLRVHFHKFMLDIHKKMHELRNQGYHEDPIPYIANELLQSSWLLCFDEFQVTDVADALILRRLFSAMLERGFVMVATSDRPPSELYKNGLQRDLFLPFIDLLSEKCAVLSLDDSMTDYRVLKGAQVALNVYNHPLNLESKAIFNHEFLRYCDGKNVQATHVTTQGRKVHVPQAAVEAGVCQFSFEELCGRPLGAADYIAIAEAFPVVFMRRFITFVDCMYDKHVRLHCLADASPEKLFTVDSSMKSHIDEVFAFDRTVSRLLEMGSEAYLTGTGQPKAAPAEHLYLDIAHEGEDDDTDEAEAV
ncbi:TPA: hypothetical protein N0F65_000111, partial [Lagenidium giganteum]